MYFNATQIGVGVLKSCPAIFPNEYGLPLLHIAVREVMKIRK